MAFDTASVLAAFREVVGQANVLTEGDLSAYTHDWRKRAQGKANWDGWVRRPYWPQHWP